MSPIVRCEVAGYVVIGLVLSPFAWMLVRSVLENRARAREFRRRMREGGLAPLVALFQGEQLLAFQLSPPEWRRYLWLEFRKQARESALNFRLLLTIVIFIELIMGIVGLIAAWMEGGFGSFPYMMAFAGGCVGLGLVYGLLHLAFKLLGFLFRKYFTPAGKATVTLYSKGIMIAGRMVRWNETNPRLTHVSVSHEHRLLTLHVEEEKCGEETTYWDETVVSVPLPRGVDARILMSRLTPHLRSRPAEASAITP